MEGEGYSKMEQSKLDLSYEGVSVTSSSPEAYSVDEHQDTARPNVASSIMPSSKRERGGRQKRLREDDGVDGVGLVHKKQKLALPKGLLNLSSACFSNACLQLFNAALTPAQVAQLTSHGVPKDFDIDGRALNQLEGKRLTSALKKLNQDIEESSPLKLAPYLGRVLADLRSDQGSVAEPTLFQRAFAFGGVGESREVFSGDTQEDASEYLRHLVSAMGEEHGFVNNAFQYQTAEAIVCTARGCQYRNELSTENGTLLEVAIPVAASSLPHNQGSNRKKATPLQITLDALIQAHFGNAMCEGSTCEACKAKNTVARQTEITQYPDHLLISINRTKFEQATGRGGHSRRGAAQAATKDTTEVQLNLGDIRIGEDKTYQLIALVKHSGARAGNGHYSAYRKVDDGKWAFLDDDVAKLVGERNLDDGVKGFSSILLLKRQT